MPYSTQVDSTPSYKFLSFGFIDAVGDKRSVSTISKPSVSLGEVESLAEALGNASNANLYRVELTSVYTSAALKSVALNQVRVSVQDNLVVTFQNAADRQTERVFIPSPKSAMFVSGTEEPNPANSLLNAVISAYDAVLGGNFEPRSVRFSERSERNRSISL